MPDISSQIVTWTEADRAIGEVVLQRAGKNLKPALLAAYQVMDPSLKELPDNVWQDERRKFDYIARGNFPAQYFEQQAVITKNIASKSDFVSYLSKTYAAYAAGLASGLVRERKWSDAKIDVLMTSLMRSVFSDASVVMYDFFRILNEEADRQRAIVEAERLAVQEERLAKAAEQAQAVAALGAGRSFAHPASAELRSGRGGSRHSRSAPCGGLCGRPQGVARTPGPGPNWCDRGVAPYRFTQAYLECLGYGIIRLAAPWMVGPSYQQSRAPSAELAVRQQRMKRKRPQQRRQSPKLPEPSRRALQ